MDEFIDRSPIRNGLDRGGQSPYSKRGNQRYAQERNGYGPPSRSPSVEGCPTPPVEFAEDGRSVSPPWGRPDNVDEGMDSRRRSNVIGRGDRGARSLSPQGGGGGDDIDGGRAPWQRDAGHNGSAAPAQSRRRRVVATGGGGRGNRIDDDFGSRPPHDSYGSAPPRRDNDDVPIGGTRRGRAVRLRGPAQEAPVDQRDDMQGYDDGPDFRSRGDRGGGRRQADNGGRASPPPQAVTLRGNRRPDIIGAPSGRVHLSGSKETRRQEYRSQSRSAPWRGAPGNGYGGGNGNGRGNRHAERLVEY